MSDVIENAEAVEKPAEETQSNETVAEAPEKVIENVDQGVDKSDTDVLQGDQSGDVLADADITEEEGLPDSYTFDAPDSMPEGVSIDEGALENYKTVAKEVALSQEQFQKLVEYSLEQTQAAQADAEAGWNSRVQEWREAARTDTEFGGENYDANVRSALKAIDKFGDNDFKALMNSPSESNPEGLAIGNHPAVLRFLNRIGKAMGDPSFVSGNEGKAEMTDTERLSRIYPTMQK